MVISKIKPLVDELKLKAIEECEEKNEDTYQEFNKVITDIALRYPDLKNNLLSLEELFVEVGASGMDLYEKGFIAAGEIIVGKNSGADYRL
ncbi:hypothetical protein [Paenibacillus polymyxa]|uniref:hypothetical protein n=1 Tax=Paenibacillus polymyxa TaxID=1406 RepID=UPI0032AFE159